jgi:4,5-dihydroxyphthalate decarboxylase
MSRPLRIVLERRPHTVPMIDGLVPAPAGVEVEWVEVKPINKAFRRMTDALEFDVCEIAAGAAFLAMGGGVPVIGLPVFPLRRYPHHGFQVRRDRGITGPADIAGKRLGTKAFTQTTGFWTRGILSRQFGVDTGSITWVVSDQEHAPNFAFGSNVEQVPGADLAGLLLAGELDAGLGLQVKDDAVTPLFTDLPAAERSWFDRTGAETINHLVVVRQDVLAERPELAGELYDWFVRSWEHAGSPVTEYGLTPGNRVTLELLLEFCREQCVAANRLPAKIDEAFAPS